jgi:predicted dehydrogenase
MVTAPMFAKGPETRLAGVWSRTAEHAQALAHELAVPCFDSFDELLDHCDAVATVVAPDAQPALATAAARAGKAVLLEKPLAFDVEAARRVADAIGEAAVGSLVVLTSRFHPPTREFLVRAAAFDALGGRGCFISGAFLGGPFAQGWRLERGCLLDVGPHLVDLLDVALGEVVEIDATGDVHGWVALTLRHASGAVSQGSLCTRAATDSRTEVELYGPDGTLFVDGRSGDRGETFATLRAEFARVARSGEAHPVDAQRGLYLQELLARAESSLTRTR